MLNAECLTKSYRGHTVVASLSMEIPRGKVVGLMAGKTTTFYMIVGLVKPDKGNVYLEGQNLADRPIHERARLGLSYLPQEPSVFRKLTVEENLLLVLDNLKISRNEKRRKVELALSDLGIQHLSKRRANTLSGGERRRLEIARALILEPLFLLLDEPYAGIDPLAVQDIQNIIKELRLRGIGIIITDHNVRETLGTVDEAYLIREGTIWMKGTPQSVVANDEVRQFYLGKDFKL